MAQRLIQTQELKQQLGQKLSLQHVMLIHMLQLPITEMEDYVNTELDENPALEALPDDGNADDLTGEDSAADANDEMTYEEQAEREERDDAMNDALEGFGMDDAMPEPSDRSYTHDADYEERVYGDVTSFYDRLKEQMQMLQLTEKQQKIMEYLIGSLDNNGFLRKDIETICDELAIYNNLDCNENEIREVLTRLQTFDPAGIGAANLQECLLLQIERRPEGKLKELMHSVISDLFTLFTKKQWDKIAESLQLSEVQTEALQTELLKLNPKPGAALGESDGGSTQQIIPDVIVETSDDGEVTFNLNTGRIPRLRVSPDFNEVINKYTGRHGQINHREKDALIYARDKVLKANIFINALKQRQRTLYLTMREIINWQHKYFVDGDEADLKPLRLRDIAERTGLNMSTISRVSNEKYAQTKWGIFPLRHFFSYGITPDKGDEELSLRKIQMTLRDILAQEDKQKPLSDEAIAKLMSKEGVPVARRTVTKYREMLGIPVARLRKG